MAGIPHLYQTSKVGFAWLLLRCIGSRIIEGDTALKVIGFISMEDPFHDKVAWSGTIYKLRESIELAGFEVRWIPYGSSLRSKVWDYFVRGWNRVFTKYKWIPRFYFRPLAKA